MPLGSLFRDEAIEHKSAREPIDRVAQVTVPYDWLMLILLAMACLFVALWATFVKIELTLPLNVMVIKPTDDRTVVSPVTARVDDVLVEVGAVLNEDDALVRVVVPDLHRRRVEAVEREKVIRGEMALTERNEDDLSQMLIETRVELASLNAAIESDEFILSPYSGEVIEVKVLTGDIATMGQEVVRVRVSESADTYAVAFVSQSQIERIPSNFDALLHCPGMRSVETINASAIGNLPQDMDASKLEIDAGFDPLDHQLYFVLSESADVADRTQCQGHILLNPRTPLQILLGPPTESG